MLVDLVKQGLFKGVIKKIKRLVYIKPYFFQSKLIGI